MAGTGREAPRWMQTLTCVLFRQWEAASWGTEGARRDYWVHLCAFWRRMTAAWGLKGERQAALSPPAASPGRLRRRRRPRQKAVATVFYAPLPPVWRVVKPIEARFLGALPRSPSSPTQVECSCPWAGLQC